MKIFICLLLLGISTSLKQQPIKVVYTKDIDVLSIEQRVYNTYLQVAECLSSNGRITISAERFALYATIMGWCESDLDTKAESNGQQGIPQFTENTRRLLDLPKDILSDSIETQIWYHYKFFMNCPNLKDVKSLEDLHMTNFKPYGIRRSKANGNPLDFNKDGWITKADMKIFHKKVNQNKFIQQLYNEI